jgi:hypothetical protein
MANLFNVSLYLGKQVDKLDVGRKENVLGLIATQVKHGV